MNKLVIGAVVILLFVSAVFFVKNNQKNTLSTPVPITPSVSPTSTTDVELIGNIYRDPNDRFTFVYPDDYTLDTQDPLHTRIYKVGETQRPQSEMSDGALMVFESIELQGESLESWVDARIQESIQDGTSEISEAKKPVTQNGFPGFYYAIRGLGTSQNTILQKNSDSQFALMITYAISDPQQREYQQEIDEILRSVELIK